MISALRPAQGVAPDGQMSWLSWVVNGGSFPSVCLTLLLSVLQLHLCSVNFCKDVRCHLYDAQVSAHIVENNFKSIDLILMI